MPAGTDFVKHEFDEAISIQRSFVEAARELSGSHPVPESRAAIKALLPKGEEHLKTLESFGALFDARGKKEDVARGMESLMQKTLRKATEQQAEESEAYEAHAVLLTLARKQQDSASSMIRIATEAKDSKMGKAARAIQRDLNATTKQLADLLGEFAVRIASQGDGLPAVQAAAQGEAQPPAGTAKGARGGKSAAGKGEQ
ncbi:MAG TPA: hypothetical protein VGW38_16220 [Chloroflexota bacterium]|nr:hypothetical protein [Chloroflexota bacterium]